MMLTICLDRCQVDTYVSFPFLCFSSFMSSSSIGIQKNTITTLTHTHTRTHTHTHKHTLFLLHTHKLIALSYQIKAGLAKVWVVAEEVSIAILQHAHLWIDKNAVLRQHGRMVPAAVGKKREEEEGKRGGEEREKRKRKKGLEGREKYHHRYTHQIGTTRWSDHAC